MVAYESCALSGGHASWQWHDIIRIKSILSVSKQLSTSGIINFRLK